MAGLRLRYCKLLNELDRGQNLTTSSRVYIFSAYLSFGLAFTVIFLGWGWGVIINPFQPAALVHVIRQESH